MIALVMTVCLLASPERCHDERMLLDVPAFTCALVGQEMVAEWLEAHPGYRAVPGWRCEPPRSERRT